MTKKTKIITRIATIVVVVAVPVAIWSQRWNIHDAMRLRSYNPPAEVSQLATDTTMNDSVRRVFYVNRPELQGREAFNQSCTSSEQTIVLGCFVSGTGIFLYNVTDERLKGIVQVTAAHEVLHAAYQRLDRREKARVNDMLEQTFAKLDNQRIKDTIEDYRKNGADITNELHSILATEVRDLPAELEQYYSQYFTSRVKIVEFSEKYEQAFTQRRQQVAAADVKLAELKQRIEAAEATLQTKAEQLKAERARMDGLLAAKNYEDFNAAVPAFNASVSAYNAQVASIRRLIDQYNALVAERNAIVTEETELVKAIDSRPDTIQAE